jgi:hypothetical protein
MITITGYTPKTRRMTRHQAFLKFLLFFTADGGQQSEDRRSMTYEDPALVELASDVIDAHQLPLYPVILDGKLLISFVEPITEHF